MKKIYIVAATAVAMVLSAAAFSAGYFPGFPIVGGAAYCNGFATGTSGQVCISTVPAGPTIVTGSELIPADTQLSSGRSPQTVLLPMAALNALPYVVGKFSNGTSQTVSANIGIVVISQKVGASSTSFSNLTIQMPAAPIDGQQLVITSTVPITNHFRVSPNTGQHVLVQSLLSPAKGDQCGTTCPLTTTYLFNSSGSMWVRLH